MILIPTTTAHGIAHRIGVFLHVHCGLNSWDTWSGKMSKQEQMDRFGVYFGRGTIHVDGTNETIVMTNKVCFGADSQDVRGIDCKVRSWFDNEPNTVEFEKQLGEWNEE